MNATDVMDVEQDRNPLSKALHDCIAAHFDVETIERVVAQGMGVGFRDEIAWGNSKNQVVYELLDKAHERDVTTDLLVCFLQESDAPELHKMIADNWPPALQQLDARNSARALVNTQHRMKSEPSVRAVIAPSREMLEELRKDINVLFNYKTLHDCLHDIQVKLYDVIYVAANQLPDIQAEAELYAYIDELDDICRDARAAAEGLPDDAAVRDQETEWVTALESAVAELGASLQHPDDRLFRKPLLCIKATLRGEPKRINRLLTIVARKLPLDELAKTIERVIEETGANAARPRQLSESLDSIRRLSSRLEEKVREHRDWQDVEKNLWEAEDCLAQKTRDSIANFTIVWDLIKEGVRPLAAKAGDDGWAKTSAIHVASIDQRLENDPRTVRAAFGEFSKNIRNHFSRVDKSLKSLCSDITTNIREPLRLLVEELDHAERI
ncbi:MULTISPECIES: hypothetical protein [Methylosinus]|uniref:Uncharacterized protein n=1 Tax=Methylosinus trichosporium (strain ATCC 35070 / NCIMB 11131 / UNIQEM 75 / OB3b) TaxID=595536 RepID=A0A2D2CYP6_METT3|nr:MULTISPECIES: hypothetical protein [Methylosinus]ATQ67862.1 hypothetical protein CQW49_08090 [Methylosinus trichosporium OB3b]OBS50717.1 hypothetical protein A8B73_20195 [Methylosinus sp. 3S-1]